MKDLDHGVNAIQECLPESEDMDCGRMKITEALCGWRCEEEITSIFVDGIVSSNNGPFQLLVVRGPLKDIFCIAELEAG